MKKNYNWWEDPKNKEEVERISWWEHLKNKEFFNFPISIINSDGIWVATCNDATKLLLGNNLHGCAQGETKEYAIKKMFAMIKWAYEYSEECRLNYQRFVPFRKGNWKHKGGKWFTIFGINIYFRYGKNMMGGRYIPLTKLNILISNDWIAYKNWKLTQKLNNHE